MKSTNTKIDALLIHSYWYDLNNLGQIDICNEIQILAVQKLLQKYSIKNLVLTGGNLYQGQPPISASIKKKLIKILPKQKHKSILTFANKNTTKGEVLEFKKVAHKFGWRYLASLGLNDHMPRIKRTFKKNFTNDYEITYFVAEKILGAKDKMIKKFLQSKEMRLLKTNEEFIKNIEMVPLGGFILEFFAKFLNNKGHLQPKFLNWFLD